MSNPFFSVIIPVFNVEKKFIFRCVESVLEQTFCDYEILIVDDGSEKKISDYLENEITTLDKKISVYHQKNQGVSGARNLGIKKSKGRYLTFIDADDVVLPFFFEEAASIIDKENADFVIGGAISTDKIRFDFERIKTIPYKTLCGNDVFGFKSYFMGKIYRFGNDGGWVNRGIAAKMVKRDIALHHLYDTELAIGEDRLWLINVLSDCKKICLVEQIWYEYYINAKSATRKYKANSEAESALFISKLEKNINITNLTEYHAYLDMILQFMHLHVYQSSIGHPECSMSVKERDYIINKLYSSKPWTNINDFQYFRNTTKKNKCKLFLYRLRLLILWWDIRRLFRNNV